MRAAYATELLRFAFGLALICPSGPVCARSLSIAGNTAVNDYDPIVGGIYSEMRAGLEADFPGTTFLSLPSLAGDLTGFDLIILNRFSSQPLQPAEQTRVLSYVMNGGNILYVGEDTGLSNDSFTLPFGISMAPDPSTDIEIAYATYTNPGSPFLNGPFGAPSNKPSGSDAAQIITLGLSAELARWDSGGVAVSAFGRNTLAPGAGFGLFLTDVNMMTPGRYSSEVGDLIANALIIPEPSSLVCLLVGAAGCIGRRNRLRTRKAG